MAAPPSDAEIAQVAAQYDIPPAILLGIVKQEGGTATYSLPTATVGAYGLNSSQMKNDPLLALTVVAQTLSQSFAQTGSWEDALSQYLTGDPTAWQSQTSSVGGQVMGILGQAATNPTFGLSGYQPANPVTFNTGAAAFTQHLNGLVGMGGVVSQQTVDGFRGQAAQIGSQQFQPSVNLQQVSEDILTAAKIPVTDANVALITTMARGEGMPGGAFNWLATTSQSEPSVGQIPNTPGVQEYASYQDGVDATAQTLLNGNYNRMIQLMRSGADLTTIASDPAVAQDLRTWQGGSSEDVNNLRALKNEPGEQKPEDKPPDPSKVGEFAAQLQGANIDPHEFAEYFATLSSARRQLLYSKRTDVSDYASMQQALSAAQVPVSQSNILAHVRQQPHPIYPSVQAGALHDAFGLATLHSVNHTGQVPTLGEAASLAGLDNRQIAEYYQQKALKAQPAPTAQQVQQGGNVVPLPGREQQRQQQSA
jgi:hypothetical protein